MKKTIITSAITAVALLVAPHAIAADKDFLKGKKLNIYIGVSAGGIYGTFARLMSKHISKHLPNQAGAIITSLRGAGGTKAMNYIYNVAPQNGTYAITPNGGIVERVLLGLGKPRYDPLKMHWLGGWGEAVNSITIRKDAGVNTIQEAMQKEVILGAIGRTSSTATIPQLMNNVLGTKFKIITGYRGGSPIRKAIETGELNGWAGQWLGWKLRKADWIRDGKIVTLVQMGSKRHADLPNVPLLSDLAKNDEQRKLLDFVAIKIADKAFVMGPGVPKARAAAVGKAYMATLRDKDFLARMTKLQYTIDPIEGATITAHVKKIMATPKPFVKKIKKALGFGGKKSKKK